MRVSSHDLITDLPSNADGGFVVSSEEVTAGTRNAEQVAGANI
jgi:hypothetical protein